MNYEKIAREISYCENEHKIIEILEREFKSKDDEIRADDQIIANHRAVINLIPECKAHGYCLAHAREWVETIMAKTMTKAADIALQQVAKTGTWDYIEGQHDARHQVHDAIIKEADA